MAATISAVLGLLIGFAFGFISFACVYADINKQAVKDGIIKNNGEIYKLEQIKM